jgi:tetratricopeptide (TPR) repeat protein
MDGYRLARKVTRFCLVQQNSYVVGAYMARTIEHQSGKQALVATVAEGPASFVRTYNSVAKEGMALAYQPPSVPEESVYLELRKAALAGDAAAVERLLAAAEATTVELSMYEGYLLFRTGELLLHQGHLDQATRAFQRLVAAKPELGAGHLGLGECYLAAGKDDLARSALEKGLELDPRAVWAAIALDELE